MYLLILQSGDPNGIRTRVTAVKGRCPRPLDDRVSERAAEDGINQAVEQGETYPERRRNKAQSEAGFGVCSTPFSSDVCCFGLRKVS